jgi:membrane associated rhomboid family serine protease
VGASGAIAAVMGAYLVWFPNAPVRTVVIFYFITIMDIRAKWLLGFRFVLQFFTSPNAGVAWVAHVGGFVFGVLVALALRGIGRRPDAPRPPGPGPAGWYPPPPPSRWPDGRY